MDDQWASVDATLTGWVGERGLSGGVLATRHGETLFEGCYGLADRAGGLPITPRTRFTTASVTKMITAAAVVSLAAEGALSFDDAVVDLVAPDRRPSTLSPDVTVHHLLTHSSGIADYCEEDEDLPNYVEDYATLWRDLPVYGIERPADFLPLFGDLPPYGPPGEVTRYSNAGYLVLGLVLEDVAGAAYIDVVTERVLDRVGMGDCGFFRFDDPVPDVAVGYVTSAGEPVRTNIYTAPVIGGPDGGMQATARDLDRFLTALADGSLHGDLTETALTRHTVEESGFGWGYGVLHYPDGRWGHGGGDPGVEALVTRYPDGLQVVALCNVDHDIVGDLRNAVAEVALA